MQDKPDYVLCEHCRGWVNTRNEHVTVQQGDVTYYLHRRWCIENTSMEFTEGQVQYHDQLPLEARW